MWDLPHAQTVSQDTTYRSLESSNTERNQIVVIFLQKFVAAFLHWTLLNQNGFSTDTVFRI